MNNKRKSKLYKVWTDMKNRCNNPNNRRYKNYGNRGIRVCDEWKNDYLKFYNWAIEHGYKEPDTYNTKYTIDRIDNDKNYEPENCRIITHKEQQNNRRNNRILTYKGESHTVSEWGGILDINVGTIFTRLRMNIPVEYVLSKEKLTSQKIKEIKEELVQPEQLN